MVEQVRNIPTRLIEPFQRTSYAKTRWTKIKVIPGQVDWHGKVCLLLVYQPHNLAPSIVETCAFLRSKGYAVMVVANGGLPPAAAELLHPYVWLLLDRPNLGYDFGGYQDGIKYLNQQGLVPESMIVLNDSIWFPLNSNSDVLEQLETSEHDLCGLMLHSPARNDEPSINRDEEKHRTGKALRKKAEHIESYLFALRREVFVSAAFQSFWENYAWSSSKSLTIKRGEIGLSKHMARHGLSVGAISTRHLFMDQLPQRDDDFLFKALVYSAYSDADLGEERDAILADSKDSRWRTKALDHIARTVKRRRFNATFPWATEQLFNTSFVKKHPGRLFQLGRIRFLEAVDAGDLFTDNEPALVELRARVAADKLALGPELQQ
ncbi:MAG: rhamnan synthesis F family protein [Paracoccaceae bacterium]